MFDAILYMNLEYRVDRKKNMLKELNKLSHITTNIHRIDAVLEKWCGHLGCGKSHVKALELAIENNWGSVLILEDDVEFVEDLSNLNKIDKIEWDVMMLGYGHKHLSDCDHEFLKKPTYTTCAHAYIVRNHYYKTLLNNFKDAVKKMTNELEIHTQNCNGKMTKLHYCSAVDQSWFSLQDKDTFYTFEPPIASQSQNMGSDNNCEIYHQNELMSKLNSK